MTRCSPVEEGWFIVDGIDAWIVWEKLQIHRCSAYPADKSRVKRGQVEKESNLHFVFRVVSLLAATRDEFPSLPGKSIGNIAGLSLSNTRRSSFLLGHRLQNSYIRNAFRTAC